MTSVVRELACPASRAISSTGTPWSLIMLTNEVRSSFGTHRAPSPAAAVTRRKSRRRLCDSYAVPTDVVNTSPYSATTPRPRPAR